jgi:hypothetical protein
VTRNKARAIRAASRSSNSEQQESSSAWVIQVDPEPADADGGDTPSDEEVVRMWSQLLVDARVYRENSIELAKHRDKHEDLTGENASALTRDATSHGRLIPVAVTRIPLPSPEVEDARVTGELRRRGYNPKGLVALTVEQRWARDAAESKLTHRTIAEAKARADGQRWPPVNVDDAVRAIAQLVGRARGRKKRAK